MLALYSLVLIGKNRGMRTESRCWQFLVWGGTNGAREDGIGWGVGEWPVLDFRKSEARRRN